MYRILYTVPCVYSNVCRGVFKFNVRSRCCCNHGRQNSGSEDLFFVLVSLNKMMIHIGFAPILVLLLMTLHIDSQYHTVPYCTLHLSNIPNRYCYHISSWSFISNYSDWLMVKFVQYVCTVHILINHLIVRRNNPCVKQCITYAKLALTFWSTSCLISIDVFLESKVYVQEYEWAIQDNLD